MHKRYNKTYSLIIVNLITIILLITSNYSFADVSVELVGKVLGPTDAPVWVVTGKVKITYPNGKSKILPYKTKLAPSVIGDQVYIITTNKLGDVSGIIVYNTKTNQPKKYPLPTDIDNLKKRFFCSPSFSPDGNKLAYYIVFDDGKGKVVVRSFPDGKLLQESQTHTLLATDVSPGVPKWNNSQGVEFEEEFFDPPVKVKFVF
jgi:hypothetical protein